VLHLAERRVVIPVPMRGDDDPERHVTDEAQQRAGLVGRVNESELTGFCAAQHVGVVVHRADRDLGDGQARQFPGVGRAAYGHVPGVGHVLLVSAAA
jgi:hypothetical protein